MILHNTHHDTLHCDVKLENKPTSRCPVKKRLDRFYIHRLKPGEQGGGEERSTFIHETEAYAVLREVT